MATQKNCDDISDLISAVGHMQVLEADIRVLQIEMMFSALEINCGANICAVDWRVPKEHDV